MTDGAEKQPKTVVVPYEFAPGHRVVYADDVTVNSKTDGLGTILELRFTRLETTPTSEEIAFAASEDGEGLTQVGPQKFKGMEPRKAVEVDVLLRPDNAFNIAKAIIARLASLKEEQKERYRIPKIEVGVLKPAQEEEL